MALKEDLKVIIGGPVEPDIVFYLLMNPGEHTQADLSKNIAKAQPDISIALSGLIHKSYIQKSVSSRPQKYQIPSLRWLKEQLRFYQTTQNEIIMKLIEGLS